MVLCEQLQSCNGSLCVGEDGEVCDGWQVSSLGNVVRLWFMLTPPPQVRPL